jgi:putative glutamine amidotransferase
MKIAITKSNTGFQNYLDWLNFFDINYIVLDCKDNNALSLFKECNGLILTGGMDIYPGFYCEWKICESNSSFTPERDRFEIELIDNALRNKKPVLGICRGNQLLNVYFKGNLIFDLEKIKGVNHKKISETEVRYHNINIKKDTLLFNIIKSEKGLITSTHHQAIDKVGEKLMVNAYADDKTAEGIEYKNKTGKGFLLGIQWHPERFNDFNNIFSKNILLIFKKEADKYNS